jgi:hypothetical protein
LKRRGVHAVARRAAVAGTIPGALFPAWVLTDQPRLSDLFAACRSSRGSDAERGWELMMAVLKLEHQGRHADLIEHRKRLKGLHEGLYRSYMKSR